VISNPESEDGDDALVNILNVPNRYIGRKFIQELKNFAFKRDVYLYTALFVNAKNRLIAIEKIADGTISRSMIYPRELIKRVIALKATGAVFVHNHPSGDPEPSMEDKNLTMKLGIALSSMDVTLLDHVIVGDNYHSMADSGYIASINTRINNFSAG
jgi:DNA repair protein RadC